MPVLLAKTGKGMENTAFANVRLLKVLSDLQIFGIMKWIELNGYMNIM
jgi:hypothetical protein